ncbi:hypothetical protein MA16_Dca014905 [Dendrobium catenatum]|uniref:Wall-associated receptor kinase C-terminal domain-containing protein n=1 Tax=Dendrobium catenatum TaxID=906689 RepID=A0A2I0WSJ9_9ASPA|nr:hypothetical protein MA16_Dca014905 [Dendrobium catenatum]
MHASAVGTDRFFYGDVVGVVKLGFRMHWDGGGGDECRRCEGSAGLCGRGPKGFVCFCESGISDKDCGEGKVSVVASSNQRSDSAALLPNSKCY